MKSQLFMIDFKVNRTLKTKTNSLSQKKLHSPGPMNWLLWFRVFQIPKNEHFQSVRLRYLVIVQIGNFIRFLEPMRMAFLNERYRYVDLRDIDISKFHHWKFKKILVFFQFCKFENNLRTKNIKPVIILGCIRSQNVYDFFYSSQAIRYHLSICD